MGSNQDFVDYVIDLSKPSINVSYKKMFGEYAIYCKDKVVGLVCDNQLFIKPTPKGESFIGKPKMMPPYPGAKPYFLVDDDFEKPNWLSKLIEITNSELPDLKPKKRKLKIRSTSGKKAIVNHEKQNRKSKKSIKRQK